MKKKLMGLVIALFAMMQIGIPVYAEVNREEKAGAETVSGAGIGSGAEAGNGPDSVSGNGTGTGQNENTTLITGWKWNDSDQNLTGGVLCFPEATAENQPDFEGVCALLPTGIVFTGNESDFEVTVSGWNCETYTETEGHWPLQGEYIFTALFPEDGGAYVYPEGMKAPSVCVKVTKKEEPEEPADKMRSMSVQSAGNEISTSEGLINIFTNGGDVKLAGDITVPDGQALQVAAGKTVSLDLNGHQLDLSGNQLSVYGTLDIKDTAGAKGKMISKYTYDGERSDQENSAIFVREGGALSIAAEFLSLGGSYAGARCIAADGGSVTVNEGASLYAQGQSVIALRKGSSCTVNGGFMQAGRNCVLQLQKDTESGTGTNTAIVRGGIFYRSDNRDYSINSNYSVGAGKITISDGYFAAYYDSGNLFYGPDANVRAAAGYYTEKPNSAEVAEGYECVRLSQPVKKTVYEYNGSTKSEKTISFGYRIVLKTPEPVTYRITFISNGGSTVGPVEAVAGTVLSEPSAPARENYTFEGWYENEGFSGEKYSFGTMPEADITLYAKWTLDAPDCPSVIASPSGESTDYPASVSLETDFTEKLNLDYTYQWYKDGSMVDGAVDRTLILTTPGDSGVYTVAVRVSDGVEHKSSGQSTGQQVTIRKGTPAYTAPVAMEGLHYKGTEQFLIQPGSAENGTMQYSTDNISWSEEIPLGKDAKTYTVYYRVIGNENYNDIPIQKITVDILNEYNPVENQDYSLNGKILNEDLIVSAKDGFLLSTGNELSGTWSQTLTGNTEGKDSCITFYVKNTETGAISLPVTVTYTLDREKPSGSVTLGSRRWDCLQEDITFGIFCRQDQNLSVSAQDSVSGIEKTEYCKSGRILAPDQIADSEWTELNGTLTVPAVNGEKLIIYVRITDKAGNVSYLSTDGVQFDTVPPVITGVENGKDYFTTQKVTVSDTNSERVTLNGTEQNNSFTIAPVGTETEYTVSAEDRAGNITTVIITMNPLSEIFAPISGLTPDNVTSADGEKISQVISRIDGLLEDPDLSPAEEKSLKDEKERAAGLTETLEDQATLEQAKNKIQDGKVTVPCGAGEAARTSAVQEYIKELLQGMSVQVSVSHGEGNEYTVGISCNGRTDSKNVRIDFVETDTDVTTGPSTVLDPVIRPDATDGERETVNKTADRLKEPGAVKESGLDETVEITECGNGDFSVDAGTEKGIISISRDTVDSTVRENGLQGKSTLQAETFLQVRIVGTQTESGGDGKPEICTEMTFHIDPFVRVVLINGVFRKVLGVESIEVENQPVMITLPLPDNFEVPAGYRIRIRHVKEDGTEYYYDAVREGNQVTFRNPDGFSEFTVCTVKEPVVDKVKPGDPGENVPSGFTDLPRTGDYGHGEMWLFLVAVSLIGLCAVLFRRTRRI